MTAVATLKNAQALAAEYQMLPPDTPVICALSGGSDSMCLLHWLSRQEGITLHAAHFDHHLRGEESQADARFVQDWCEAHRIPFHLGGTQVAEEASRWGKGIEETARALRYAFLQETAEALGGAVIATAHTADDNAETLLLHLVRGTGLQGLTGIPPRRGNIVRPFLTTSRGELLAYREEYHIPFREDSSNRDLTYARNRLRAQVLPVLEELNPRFSQAASSAARSLRVDNDYLNSLAQKACESAHWEGQDLVLAADAVAQLPPALAPRAARRLIELTTGGSTDCSYAHLQGLVELCRSQDPSAALSLPHGLTARRVYGEVRLTQGPAPVSLEALPLQEGENPIPGTGWTAVLEGPPWPGLAVRSRQTGDKLTLPGRPEKSLKKLLIDQKVPRTLRETIPVAADDQGVLSVAGIGPNTAHPRFQRLTWSKHNTETKQEG